MSVFPQDAASRRLTWMDTLRGVAILLVLVLHASALSLMLSGVDGPIWLQVVNSAVLPYRMQVLMVLSGMLLGASLSKPPGRYVLGKVRSLVWPYVIWSVVYWVAVGQATVPRWHEWVALSWLWYIFFLATYFAIAPVLVRVPTWIPPLVFWTASALVTDPDWTNYLLYAGYFFAGHAAWSYRGLIARAYRPWMGVVAVVSTIAFSAAYVAQDFGVTFLVALRREELLYAPLNLLGIAGLIVLVRRLPDGGTRILRHVGRNSVVFYLSHYPAQIIVTNALSQAGVSDWRAHVGGGLAVALVVGYALTALRRFPVVDALFVMPWPKTRNAAGAPRAVQRRSA